jgi:hypothetical protein
MAVRAALLLFVSIAFALGAAQPALAQGGVSIRINKHAELTPGGGVRFGVRVTCGPLPGSEDFREGLAGAGQKKTGAAAEGGLSPDIVCDGVRRVYAADLSVFTDEVFKRGRAVGFAAVTACNVVGDEQVCAQASARRQIVISGRRPA